MARISEGTLNGMSGHSPGHAMRILIVTSMYPSQNAPGYAPYMADQVRSLRELGLDIELLEFNPRGRRINYGLVFPSLIRALRAGCDVVHTHHSYTLLLLYASRQVAGVKVPLVLTNHEGEALDFRRQTRTWHPTSWLRHSLYLKRLAARNADFAFFVSRKVRDAVVPDEQCEILPCGVDMGMFRPLDRGICRQKLGLPASSRIIFFPNNPRGAGKRFELAHHVYEILRKRNRLVELIVADGSIPHKDMPLYYNAADVVLQASYYEASPTVVKEAVSCEIPLVSTDSGDTGEIVQGLPYCFVCPDDPATLASRIGDCFDHRAVGGRQRLRDLGLGLDQVARRLAEVYRGVVREFYGSSAVLRRDEA